MVSQNIHEKNLKRQSMSMKGEHGNGSLITEWFCWRYKRCADELNWKWNAMRITTHNCVTLASTGAVDGVCERVAAARTMRRKFQMWAQLSDVPPLRTPDLARKTIDTRWWGTQFTYARKHSAENTNNISPMKWRVLTIQSRQMSFIDKLQQAGTTSREIKLRQNKL